MIVRWITALVFCAVVLATGVVHGVWTNRWQSTHALEEAASRVPLVAVRFGNWQGTDLEVDTEAYAQAGAAAYWMRRYVDAKSGESYSVILMCGRGGRMAVHTPDVCYQGAGYKTVSAPKKVTLSATDAPASEFWTSAFAREHAPEAGQLRLYWTWGHDGSWQAPDYPRFTFRGQPVLYKLYVLRQGAPGVAVQETPEDVAFLRQLLTEFKETLFSEPAPRREEATSRH